MKAIKLPVKGSENGPFSKEKASFPKSALILNVTHLMTLRETQTYLKKNYFSFKLDFNETYNPRNFLRILNRNRKYLRGIRPPLPYNSSTQNALKQVKNVKDLDILRQLKYVNTLWRVPVEIKKEKEEHLLNLLFRGNFPIKKLRINSTAFNYLQKLCPQRLEKISNIFIASNIRFNDEEVPNLYANKEMMENLNDQVKIEMKNLILDLNRLENLSFLTLDLTHYLFMLDQDLLYDIFQDIGDLPNLTHLRICGEPRKLEKRKGKMKKSKENKEKFLKLSNLALEFMMTQVDGFGSLFTDLLNFNLKNISSLTASIKKPRLSTLDCTDLADFISSLKNLSNLILYFDFILFIEYENLLRNVQKLKKLTKLSLKQQLFDSRTNDTFAFGILKKTVQSLKSLRKISIDLGSYTQDPQEMKTILKFFQNHPSLEKLKICLQRHFLRLEEYEFNEEFYEDIKSLIAQLKSFKLRLRKFPEDVSKKVIRIFSDSEKDPNQYNCRILDLQNPSI